MNAITWFEIPAADFDRAVSFYETIFGATLSRKAFNGVPNGIFPHSEGKVGGAVVQVDYATPADSGVVLYLNATSPDNLDAILARVPSAGGQVVMPKLDIGPIGVMAFIRDTEGNRVGLHARHG